MSTQWFHRLLEYKIEAFRNLSNLSIVQITQQDSIILRWLNEEQPCPQMLNHYLNIEALVTW